MILDIRQENDFSKISWRTEVLLKFKPFENGVAVRRQQTANWYLLNVWISSIHRQLGQRRQSSGTWRLLRRWSALGCFECINGVIRQSTLFHRVGPVVLHACTTRLAAVGRNVKVNLDNSVRNQGDSVGIVNAASGRRPVTGLVPRSVVRRRQQRLTLVVGRMTAARALQLAPCSPSAGTRGRRVSSRPANTVAISRNLTSLMRQCARKRGAPLPPGDWPYRGWSSSVGGSATSALTIEWTKRLRRLESTLRKIYAVLG